MIRLDLSGLKCPLPVLRTKRALARLRAGDRIEVIATDPLAGIDIPHLCANEGHQVLRQERLGGVMAFVIVKGE